MIRIISGKYRSRKLETPSVTITKPTMDKVKAGIFSSLSSEIINAEILDLYAGSGAFSLESVSRGAKSFVAVELNKQAIQVIKNNIKTLELDCDFSVIQSDAITYLNSVDKGFDIIFIDPPYKYNYEEILEALVNSKACKKSSIIVIETEKEIDLSIIKSNNIKEYKYSKTHVYIVRGLLWKRLQYTQEASIQLLMDT